MHDAFNAHTAFVLTTADGQQIMLDQQNIVDLAASTQSPEFLTADGQKIVLHNTPQEILSAIGLSDDMVNSLMAGQQCLQPTDDYVNPPQDILAAALADAAGFTQEHYIDDVLQPTNGLDPGLVYPLQQTATASTTETVATKPIMSTLEQPSKSSTTADHHRLTPSSIDVLGPPNLEQSLAVIGVTHTNVPTSLELPITITNPAIAPPPSSTNPMSMYACSSTNSGVPILGLTASNPMTCSIASASAEAELHFNPFSNTVSSTHTIDSTHDEPQMIDVAGKDDGIGEVVIQQHHHHHHQYDSQGSNGRHYFVDDPHALEMDTEIVPVTPESVTYAARTSPFGQNDFSCDSSDSSSEIPIQPTFVRHHRRIGNGRLDGAFEALRGSEPTTDHGDNGDDDDDDDHHHQNNVHYADDLDHVQQELIVDQHPHYIQIPNGDVLVDADLQFMDDADVFVDCLETDANDPADVFGAVSLDEHHGPAANYAHR